MNIGPITAVCRNVTSADRSHRRAR